jgi:D-threonate/D-erythronate kinase
MRPQIVIVADDITGAADCGVVCTAAGLSTVVVLSEASNAEGLDAEAIAFDADTRRQPPEAAAKATEHAVRQLCAGGGVRILYKKIDSTLRGNFAVEIAAARKSSAGLLVHGEADQVEVAPPLAIVAPAFPATGRTTRHGRMFVRGTPLEESEVWRNERISGVGDLLALLQTRAALKTALLELETMRAGVENLTAALANHAGMGVEAVVCDAETEQDLRAIAEAAAQLREPALFAGSAGLARYLPQAFGLAQKPAAAGRDRPSGCRDPTRARLLFVVGSMSQVSQEQLRHLATEPGVRALTIAPSALRAGASSSGWQCINTQLKEAVDHGDDVALALNLDEGIALAESVSLSRALAQLLVPVASRFSGLFCTGGETARALLNAAGAVGIRLAGEVEPGIPLGTVEGWHNLPIITKAGAFGSPQTLVRCRAALRRFLALEN